MQSEPVELSGENLVRGKPRMQLMLLVIPAVAFGLRDFECKILRNAKSGIEWLYDSESLH